MTVVMKVGFDSRLFGYTEEDIYVNPKIVRCPGHVVGKHHCALQLVWGVFVLYVITKHLVSYVRKTLWQMSCAVFIKSNSCFHMFKYKRQHADDQNKDRDVELVIFHFLWKLRVWPQSEIAVAFRLILFSICELNFSEQNGELQIVWKQPRNLFKLMGSERFLSKIIAFWLGV